MNIDKDVNYFTRGNASRKDMLKDKKQQYKNKVLTLILYFVILCMFAIITILTINKIGNYPWGSETFGYLYKGNILYDSFINGESFISYDINWYNGTQLLKGSEPIPYYLLALINLLTNDIYVTFSVFITLVFIVGGTGFLLWGYYCNRFKLGLFFGILWFFIPNNLRVLFSEGNLQLVIINALIPYLLLIYYKATRENKFKNYVFLSVIICIISLNSMHIVIMILLALFLLAVFDTIRKNYFGKKFFIVLLSLLGILLSAFWLVPALGEGLLNSNKSEVIQKLTQNSYSLLDSISPVLRFYNVEVYYFGLSFFLVGIFSVLFMNGRRDIKNLSFYGILIFIGTSNVFIKVLKNIPFSEFLIFSKVTSIAIALILVSILLWRNLRKVLIVIICFILLSDSMLTFDLIGHNREFPEGLVYSLDYASEIATQRIGILDLSQYGALPSYYLKYGVKGKSSNQVFGWQWKSANTSENIVMINTALENNYYLVMFDRCIQLGADTLLIKKDLINDFNYLDECANPNGYIKVYEDTNDIIYKYPIEGTFGTTVKFDGIAIGKYAENICYSFPNFTKGDKDYIDDYTVSELSEFKAIFLSGFKYRDKKKAEDMLKEISEKGIRVVVDSNELGDEEFLGISSKKIDLEDNYGEFYFKGERVKIGDFPEDEKIFRCSYLLGGKDDNNNYINVDTRMLEYMKYYNENLVFLGLNIPYFEMITKDDVALEILEEATNMESYILPDRKCVNIQIDFESNRIMVNSENNDVIVPIAALSSFETIEGSYQVFNNLVNLKSKELVIEVTYPKLSAGITISLISVLLILIISKSMVNGRIKSYLTNNEELSK